MGVEANEVVDNPAKQALNHTEIDIQVTKMRLKGKLKNS